MKRRCFRRSALAAADAQETLALCLNERAPFSLIDFFTGGGNRAVGVPEPRQLGARKA
jgi:hypothetical protein